MQASNDVETFVQGALSNPSRCIPERPFLFLDGNLAVKIGECVKKRGYDASWTYTHNGFTYIKVQIKIQTGWWELSSPTETTWRRSSLALKFHS